MCRLKKEILPVEALSLNNTLDSFIIFISISVFASQVTIVVYLHSTHKIFKSFVPVLAMQTM